MPIEDKTTHPAHSSKPISKEDLSFLPSGAKLYFVGIGGISMSGLAEISMHLGYSVAGSDMHLSARTQGLVNKGAKVFPTQAWENIESFQPDLVIHTAAILPNNSELSYSRSHGFKTVDRAQFLGYLTAGFEKVINIAGTHGKTTTTAMTSLILWEAAFDPTVHLGAELSIFSGSVRMGYENKLLVSEACEYQHSFLKFYSTTAAITNIDYDHVDCFANLEEVIDAFAHFGEKISEDGILVVPAFDENIPETLERMKNYRSELGLSMPRIISTGTAEDVFPLTGQKPEVYADNIAYQNGYPQFSVYVNNQYFAQIQLQVPGKHNLYNALTAIACAYANGAEASAITKALESFDGADGRYTFKGTFQGAAVVVDYAHHPAAARATLAAAEHIPHKDLWVVFQPLTFNRTQALFDDFVSSLLPAPHILFSEIFSDREINPGTVSSKDLAQKINSLGGKAEFFEDKKDIVLRLKTLVKEGDLLLILGPEDIRELADDLVITP